MSSGNDRIFDATEIIAVATRAETEFRRALAESSLQPASVFVVGSMASGKPRRRASDLDLRSVVKVLDGKGLQRLISVMSAFAAAHSKPTLTVGVGTRIGIERLNSVNPSLLLHIVILTRDELLALPTTHLRAYASNYRLLDGEDVLRPYVGMNIRYDDILDGPEGVRGCITMLGRRETTYAYRDLANDPSVLTLSTESQTLSDTLECIVYSVRNCTANMLAWFNCADLAGLDRRFGTRLMVLHDELSGRLNDYEAEGFSPAATSKYEVDNITASAISYLHRIEDLVVAAGPEVRG